MMKVYEEKYNQFLHLFSNCTMTFPYCDKFFVIENIVSE